jgi:hypothetical protein
MQTLKRILQPRPLDGNFRYAPTQKDRYLRQAAGNALAYAGSKKYGFHQSAWALLKYLPTSMAMRIVK